jgi:membrane protein
VLSELKAGLNTVWRTRETGGVTEVVKRNVVFLGMILGIAFLLTVSLMLSAALAAAGKFMGGVLPLPEVALQALEFLVSLGVITVLFAAIYKVLPNVEIDWHDVWIGAAVTALLFSIGKILLGLYLGKLAAGSVYGAAGSILIVFLWVYYSGLIVYLGAEFTRVYAKIRFAHQQRGGGCKYGINRILKFDLRRRCPDRGIRAAFALVNAPRTLVTLPEPVTSLEP